MEVGSIETVVKKEGGDGKKKGGGWIWGLAVRSGQLFPLPAAGNVLPPAADLLLRHPIAHPTHPAGPVPKYPTENVPGNRINR